jgi:hypothetical protein
MIKRTITYKDFDGNLVTEDYCFHMMEADFVDLDFKYEDFGGLRGYLTQLIKDIQEKGENAPKRPMYEFLKEMISVSVGKRVANRFDRSQEIKDRFFQTGAYSGFLIELLNDPNGIPAFIEGITPEVPAEKRKEAIEQLKADGVRVEGIE